MKKRTFVLLAAIAACTSAPKTELEVIDKLKILDKPMKKPAMDEWLFEHKEAGQTLADYQKLTPAKPNEQQHVIYLQPIGTFTAEQDSLMQFTAEYVGLFFNLETIVLKTLPESLIPKQKRRMNQGIEQLLTRYILDSLLNDVPKNALVTMAITAKDLYPSPNWNFVFGEANIAKRKAVSSIFRYPDTTLAAAQNRTLCLDRLIKTSAHEIGHMFSCLHCIHAQCVMNGSNHLPESDAQPNALCSECLKKLSPILAFDNKKRLTQLRDFYQKHGLNRDFQATMAALKVIGE